MTSCAEIVEPARCRALAGGVSEAGRTVVHVLFWRSSAASRRVQFTSLWASFLLVSWSWVARNGAMKKFTPLVRLHWPVHWIRERQR